MDPSGRDVEPGEVGELLLHGPEMMLGYVREELNAHAFTPDGWFRTGDLGSLAADGQVRITGRLKDVRPWPGSAAPPWSERPLSTPARVRGRTTVRDESHRFRRLRRTTCGRRCR